MVQDLTTHPVFDCILFDETDANLDAAHRAQLPALQAKLAERHFVIAISRRPASPAELSMTSALC